MGNSYQPNQGFCIGVFSYQRHAKYRMASYQMKLANSLSTTWRLAGCGGRWCCVCFTQECQDTGGAGLCHSLPNDLPTIFTLQYGKMAANQHFWIFLVDNAHSLPALPCTYWSRGVHMFKLLWAKVSTNHLGLWLPLRLQSTQMYFGGKLQS